MVDEGRPGRVFFLKERSQKCPCQDQAGEKYRAQPEQTLGSVYSTNSHNPVTIKYLTR